MRLALVMINALRTELLIYNYVSCCGVLSLREAREQKKTDIWLLARACRPWSKFHKLLMPYTGNVNFQNLATCGSWLTPFGAGVSVLRYQPLMSKTTALLHGEPRW